MKKLFISLVIIALIITGGVSASIAFTDFTKIYQEFVKSTRIDVATLKTNNFRIIKFPVPYLVIEEIKQEGKIALKDIKIEFLLGSLFRFNPEIKELTIGEAVVHLNNDDVNFLSHSEFISELILKEALSVKAKVSKLTFVESDHDVPFTINNFNFSSGNEGTNFEGSIDNIGSIKGSFEKSANNNNVVFKIDVQDTSYNFKLNETYKDGLLEEGKAELKTTNLSSKIAKLIPDFGNVGQYLSSNEEVKINFDIKPLKQGLSIESIIINSDSLQGKGEMKLSKDSAFISDINIEFSKLDLANWLNSKTDESIGGAVRFGSNNRFDFSKNNLNVSFVAKAVKIDENNSLSDVNLKIKIADGQFFIQNFSGQVDQDGKFNLSGSITQNSFRSLFNGKVILNHKDLNDFVEFFGGKEVRTDKPIPFDLSSDIKFSSVDISLQNFLIKTHETEVMGSLSSKFIGNSPRTNASIRFTSVNIDENSFPVLSRAFAYLRNLSEGMQEEAYLNKFIPIRKISSISSFDITFDYITLNKKLYENVNFVLDLSPGRVTIEQLYITDGTDWIDTNLSLEAQSIRPSVKIDINNGSVAVDFLSAPAMLALKQKILNDFDLSKIDIVTRFSLARVYQGDFSLGKVIFLAKNDKNLIDISKFEADLFGGRLQSTGSVLLQPYTLNFVYALNSAQIEQISKLLPKEVINSGGVISASGMWSTNGEKLDEQLYNLYTKSNIVTKDTTLNNFSIDNFIQTLGDPNYDINSFNEDLNKTLLLDKTQVSDLQASVELSKGIFTLPSIAFKTKYSIGQGSATFNLYDFNVDATSNFSFYLAKPKYGRSSIDYAPAKMSVTAKGNLFNPKKEANTEDLKEVLKTRLEK
jgi:hypothetical protein